MEKVYREMLDILRAEVAELYRLRRTDADRLGRLEHWAGREQAAWRHGNGIAEHRPGSGESDMPPL